MIRLPTVSPRSAFGHRSRYEDLDYQWMFCPSIFSASHHLVCEQVSFWSSLTFSILQARRFSRCPNMNRRLLPIIPAQCHWPCPPVYDLLIIYMIIITKASAHAGGSRGCAISADMMGRV